MPTEEQKRRFSDDAIIPDGLDLEDKFAYCIGHLMASWGVAESLVAGIFICVTSPHNRHQGEISWLSSRSNKAKMDLLRRCTSAAQIGQFHKDCIYEIIDRFLKIAETRNFYAHCTYAIDPKTLKLVSFIGYQLNNKPEGFQQKIREATPNTLNGLRQSIKACNILGRDIFPFLETLQDECGAQHLGLPELPDGYPRSTKYLLQ